MALVGFVFAGLLMVPVQGVMTAALIYEMEKQSFEQKAVQSTIMLQLVSMLSFNAVGNLIGLCWWKNDLGLDYAIFQPEYYVILMTLIGIVLAVLAARKEVAFFKQHRSLAG